MLTIIIIIINDIIHNTLLNLFTIIIINVNAMFWENNNSTYRTTHSEINYYGININT